MSHSISDLREYLTLTEWSGDVMLEGKKRDENKINDIMVTTPRHQSKNAEAEARSCVRAGGGDYFRRFARLPKGLKIGSRLFYVEDGYLRGYAVVSNVRTGQMRCDVTGKKWAPGAYAVMRADSWKWIRPIPIRGFQGWRYMPQEIEAEVQVVGGWKDPKPEVKKSEE